MPIPVMLGIPWLASVLGGMFTAIAVWLAQYMTRRLALVLAAIALIAALTAALFSALNASIAALSLAVPSQYSAGIAMICPSNLPACVSIIITAHLLRYAYDWNVRVIQYKLL